MVEGGAGVGYTQIMAYPQTISTKRETGFVFHELYLWHSTGIAAAEAPASLTVEPDLHIEDAPAKRRFRNLLEVAGLLEVLHQIKPHYASEDDLALVHDREYIKRVKELSDMGGGRVGNDTPFGRGGYEIACLAAGGASAALTAVCKGDVRNAYALIRPPGHHATAKTGMGFCIFNSPAVAIRAAQKNLGVGRVAHLDWDVHHGNGTQDIFYDDNTVLTISLHQDGKFPRDTGKVDEGGSGDGKGYNINIPLPPGSGDGAYLTAIEEVALPAMESFRPDAVTVSCGFDAGAMDPLGRMMCHSETFRAMTRMTREFATTHCDGRLALFHEGGYFAPFVPYCGLAVVEELCGAKTNIQDPFLGSTRILPGQDLQPHQQAVIDAAKENLSLLR